MGRARILIIGAALSFLLIDRLTGADSGFAFYNSAGTSTALPSLLVTAPGPVTLTVHGNSKLIQMTVDVIDPDGNVIKTWTLGSDYYYDGVEPGPYWSTTIYMTKRGVYRLRPVISSFDQEPKYRFFLSGSAPYFVMPGGVRYRGTYRTQSATYFFYVPAGVTGFDFHVRFYGGFSGQAIVADANGEIKANISVGHYSTQEFTVPIAIGSPTVSGSFWTVSTANSILSFDVIGIPNWFAGTREQYFVPETAYVPYARGGGDDLDGDGKSDLLWRHAASNATAVWFMNGGTPTWSRFIPDADASWALRATGDINRDGKNELLWQNVTTGELVAWYMAGFSVESTAWLVEANPGPQYRLGACSDYNGDGYDDFILVPAPGTHGRVRVWMMNGWSAMDRLELPVELSGEWTLAAVADFDRNGTADFLWRNVENGDNALWLMAGKTILNTFFINGALPSWTIAGAGDFDGDGLIDLAWRNYTTGQNAIWFMRWTAVRDTTFIDSIEDPNWMLVGPR